MQCGSIQPVYGVAGAPGVCRSLKIQFSGIVPEFLEGIHGFHPSCNPFRGNLFWQGFCPDGYVIILPVRPLCANTIRRIACPVDLPGDRMGKEIERDFPLGHESALRRHVFRLSKVSLTVLLIVIIHLPSSFPIFFLWHGHGIRAENPHHQD